jgi:hypothetical protein
MEREPREAATCPERSCVILCTEDSAAHLSAEQKTGAHHDRCPLATTVHGPPRKDKRLCSKGRKTACGNRTVYINCAIAPSTHLSKSEQNQAFVLVCLTNCGASFAQGTRGWLKPLYPRVRTDHGRRSTPRRRGSPTVRRRPRIDLDLLDWWIEIQCSLLGVLKSRLFGVRRQSQINRNLRWR